MALTQEQLRAQVEKRIANNSPSGIPRGTPSVDTIVDAATDELENQQMIENAKNYEANKKLEEENKKLEEEKKLASVGLATIPAAPREVASQQALTEPSFVSQADPQTAATASKLQVPVSTNGEKQAIAGINAQGIAASEGETQKAQVYNDLLAQEQQRAKQEEERAIAFQSKSNELMADIEKTKQEIANFKFEEPSIWKNKSTPQKILFGIGAFLGSITPQGANNIVKMIDDEISRDIAGQKAEYEKLGNKLNNKQNTYKMYYDKYKDESLAAAAAKNARLDMVKLHFEKISATTNSKIVLGKAQEAIGKIKMEQGNLQQNMAVQLQKLYKDGVANPIEGYKGNNKNASIVKDLTDRVSAKKSAEFSIKKLETLLNEGASTPGTKNYALAEQIRRKLSADLAKAMFGRSSDSELQEARALIPDVSAIFSRKSNTKELLKNLKTTLNAEVDAYANTAGFSKDAPLNAERLD
jgi:hypothetical protein